MQVQKFYLLLVALLGLSGCLNTTTQGLCTEESSLIDYFSTEDIAAALRAANTVEETKNVPPSRPNNLKAFQLQHVSRGNYLLGMIKVDAENKKTVEELTIKTCNINNSELLEMKFSASQLGANGGMQNRLPGVESVFITTTPHREVIRGTDSSGGQLTGWVLYGKQLCFKAQPGWKVEWDGTPGADDSPGLLFNENIAPTDLLAALDPREYLGCSTQNLQIYGINQ